MVRGKDIVSDIGATAMTDIDKLSKWLSDSRIDPNDPANSELVYLLKVSLCRPHVICQVSQMDPILSSYAELDFLLFDLASISKSEWETTIFVQKPSTFLAPLLDMAYYLSSY